MIRAASNPRDRAIIALLYDSGCRIGEIGNLKIKHVVFDQYGGVLHVDGKTGNRRVRIIFSCPYLASWLEHHPFKDNPESYMWINIGHRQRELQMQYQAFAMMIKRLAKKAGIKKNIHAHLFRHSRSTELAQHLTQAQMESHLGWIHGSTMPATYIHLSGSQVDDALLKMYGLKPEEQIPTLSYQICTRCKLKNGATSDFCSQCGATLRVETAISMDEKREELMLKLMKLVENDLQIAKILNDVG